MADVFKDAFGNATSSDKAEMAEELDALYRDREHDKHRCAPQQKLTFPGPGGGGQRGADNYKLISNRNHIHMREKRIRELEDKLGKTPKRTGGRKRRR